MERILPEVKNIYLVGIGGAGMSGLAFLLKDKGFCVSGSDVQESYNTKLLKKEGIKVFIGHRKEQITSDIDILGSSAAVEEDNPEIIQAKQKGISVLGKGQILAKLCQGRKTIAIAGSHGKTTTSSLLGYLLTCLGHKPAVFVGGLPLNYTRGAWWGEDYFVIETDESDGSFLDYEPCYSVITNIDHEHLDYHGSFKNLQKEFLKFARQTKDKIFGWGDQPFLWDIISEVGGLSFGWDERNYIRGKNFRFDSGSSCFDLYIDKKFITPIRTPLKGKHNCLNTLAVLAFLHYIGEDLEKANKALSGFKGTKRRFEIKEKIAGVTFIDDYAHHPTEIKAVLEAAKLLSPKRVFVVFQPHRYSRVKALYDEFCGAFGGADKVVITDIYNAHEKNLNCINSKDFASEVGKNYPGNVEYVPKNELSGKIHSYFRDGDIVLALGAGDINKLMEKVRDEFKKNRVTI